jgi:hypothetical protein
MARPPGTVAIGPYVYSIRFDHSRLREAEDSSGAKTYGHTSHSFQEIVIDPTIPARLAATTLWHEVKHAIAGTVGFESGKYEEEDWIARTAPMEVATLQGNPDLIAYLLEPEDARQ